MAFFMALFLKLTLIFFVSSCVNAANPDWMAQAPVNAAPITPVENAIVAQNPPTFLWPHYNTQANTQYYIQLEKIGGSTVINTVFSNFYIPNMALASGKYRWRVMTQGQWSNYRNFTIESTARSWGYRDPNLIYSNLANLPHPRSIPSSVDWTDWLASLKNDREKGWSDFINRVNSKLGDELPIDYWASTSSDGSADRAAVVLGTAANLNVEAIKLQESSLAWVVTKDKKYLNDAKRRLLYFSGWNINGYSAFEPAHHGPRNLLWAIAIAYDQLYQDLTSQERELVLQAVETRLTQMLLSLDDKNKNLELYPRNSHYWVSLMAVAPISALIAGDSTQAKKWFTRSLPWSFSISSVWGNGGTGFGNGLSYSQWDMDTVFQYWDALRNATGVNAYQTDYLMGMGDFWSYFAPPDNPKSLFGDGQEGSLKALSAYYARTIGWRTKNKNHLWSVQFTTSSFPSNYLQITSPVVSASQIAMPFAKNSRLFPNIGWLALHSEAVGKDRVSIFFRNSYFGSFNHSHANQNDLIVNRNGSRLLDHTGSYDWYGSEHWKTWYIQSKAHNVPTYNGGQGQIIGAYDALAGIGSYFENDLYAAFSANSASAYNKDTKNAIRRVVYLKPSIVLVQDVLESNDLRNWEWNFHTQNQFYKESNEVYKSINSAGESLCVKQLAGSSANFNQNNVFPVNPEKQNFEQQNHSSFNAVSAAYSAEFIVLLDIGCQLVIQPSVSFSEGLTMIKIGEKTVQYSKGSEPLIK